MKHITKLTVRPYECDSYNHVNNAVYLNYLEHARMDFLHAAGFDYKGIVAAGYYLYDKNDEIQYKASAFLDDELEIESYPTKLKHVMGEFHQTIKKKVCFFCAELFVSWARVSTQGRPSKLPEQFIVPGLVPDEN